MKRTSLSTATCLAAVASVAAAGGAGAQVRAEIGEGLHNTGRAGLETLDQTYNGIGSVAATPFRDFGVVRTKLPPPLEEARIHPYAVRGLDSCQAVLNEVAELDLVLGPDIDTPDIEKQRNMYNSAADLAGSAAVDAMRSAVNHFIPMHDTIRKITGAEKAQRKMEKAVLSGKVRRGFLKSYGMQHNCAWPAAPAGFRPAPGGPVWTHTVEPVAPPPPPMKAAVIAALTPGEADPGFAPGGAPAPAASAEAPPAPQEVAAAAPVAMAPAAAAPAGSATRRGAGVQLASAAAPIARPALAPGAPVAMEAQAGAWRIGPVGRSASAAAPSAR